MTLSCIYFNKFVIPLYPASQFQRARNLLVPEKEVTGGGTNERNILCSVAGPEFGQEPFAGVSLRHRWRCWRMVVEYSRAQKLKPEDVCK